MVKKLNPFFSIIIPALNEESYLPHLLKDLAKQSYQDFEVIVVDGNSDDHTVQRTRSFSTKLPSLKITNSPKRHVCTQRNLGAKSARANWLIFMDADNRLPPYFLLGLKYRLESNPTDIATCWVIPDSNTSLNQSITTAINYATELIKNSASPAFPESMTIISQHAFRQIGGFDESINYAESRPFAETAKELELRFRIYKDPAYTYSFRRIRKYGVLNLAGRLAKHEITRLLGSEYSDQQIREMYPMQGGKFFDTPRSKQKRFITNIKTLFQEISSADTLKRKLQQLLED